MKTHSDYASYLEEALLLMLTSAVFFLELAQKNTNPCPSGMLQNFSRLLEKHIFSLSEMVALSDAPHLNPAYLKRATDNPKADLELALDDIFVLKSRLLYLAAYAPDEKSRHNLIHIAGDAALIADFLMSVI